MYMYIYAVFDIFLQHPPFVRRSKTGNGSLQYTYSGIDIEMLNVLAWKMNFK